MRRTVLVAVAFGLVAMSLPTAQANAPLDHDTPDAPAACASVDRDTTDDDAHEDPEANVDHPDDPEDRISMRVEARASADATDGARVAVSLDIENCLAS